MDIICVHSDDEIRDIIRRELAGFGFTFKCFSSIEEVMDVKATVALVEFTNENEFRRFHHSLIIPLIKTTSGEISYELERRGIDYITVDSLKNFKQRLMKILIKNRDRIKSLSEQERFLKNTIYAYGFEWGRMYTVSVSKVQEVYEFVKNIPRSIYVFIASRERPGHFVKKDNIKYIWVTDILGKDRIKPYNLTVLTDMITRFLEEGDKRIVVMDCIEYLLLYNDILNVLRNIELLNSYAMEYDSLIILIIDENAYSRRDLSLLQRYAKKWNGGD